MALRIAIFDGNILPLYIAEFPETLAERFYGMPKDIQGLVENLSGATSLTAARGRRCTEHARIKAVSMTSRNLCLIASLLPVT